MVEEMLSYYLREKYGVRSIESPYVFATRDWNFAIDHGIDYIPNVDMDDLLCWAINYGRMLDR